MSSSFYTLLLRFFPKQMRKEFGADMRSAFHALCEEQKGRAGALALVYYREALDALRSGLRARRQQPDRKPNSGSVVPRLPRTREGGGPVQAFLQDLRFGARALASKPAFAGVVALTLALGIGAATLIFSVADTVLFRPLPYDAPEQLVMVGSEFGRSGRLSPLTPPDFLEFRERNDSFAGVAASASATFDLGGEGTPRRLRAARVSAGFFDVLGVAPARGRGFTGEEEIPGGDRVAILSSDAWRSHWGADETIVGRSITLNRIPYVVVGIMPASFRPPEGIRYQPDADIWVPLAIDRQAANRFASYLWVIGRLDEGVTLDGAAQELDTLGGVFRQEFYNGQGDFAFRVEALFDRTVGDIGGSLAVLMGAVGLLLLIACANVANLSLARGGDRAQEIAMRAALGAGQGRVIQQLLIESLLIAFVGGVGGAVLAFGGVQILPLIDPGRLPRAAEIAVDLRVLLFAFALSAATGLAFGLVPALRVSRAQLSDVLKSGPRPALSSSRDRVRGGLLVAQVALALILLLGAGLLINSFVRLRNVDPGFDAENLMIMRLYIPPESPTGSRWAPSSEAEWEGWRTFFGELLDRVDAIPGVVAAAGTTSPPIVGAEIWMEVSIEGREADPESPNVHADNRVSPRYFDTIGSRLIRGREFSRADDQGASHAIVNEAFAEQYWPGEDAIGMRLQYGSVPDPAGDWMTVVGIVENTEQAELGAGPEAEFFVPFFQNPLRAMAVMVRYEGAADGIVDAMRAAVWDLKPDLPVDRIETMESTIGGSIVLPRFYTLLLTAFATVSMLLAAIGIYSTMAYSVGQRTREVGVRLALGARPGDVLRMVVAQGLRVTSVGVVVGVAGALTLGRSMQNVVFGVEPTDPMTFTLVIGLLVIVAGLACYIPARRASVLDPADTLRRD